MKIVRIIQEKAYRFGFAGVFVITIGMLISAVSYVGRSGERYSFLNHFVSELGEYANSELALVFNIGLVLGGIFFIAFMLGLAAQLKSAARWIFGLVGLVTSISGGLVGVFSMDNLGPHFLVAMTFFYSGLIITILFSVYILIFDRGRKFAYWLAVPGGISAAAFFVFLFLVDPLVPENAPPEAIFDTLTNRPAVIETAVFEWVVVFSILAWILCLSIYLYLMSKSLNANRR